MPIISFFPSSAERPQIVVVADIGMTISVQGNGETQTKPVKDGYAVFYVSKLGKYTVRVLKDGVSKATTYVTVDESKFALVDVKDIPSVYGVTWDGSPTHKWIRTNDSAMFVDPVPETKTQSGSSPFDDIQPWAGMTQEYDASLGALVRIPKFYYQWSVSGNSVGLKIAAKPIDGFHTSPVHIKPDGSESDYVVVGRYHCGPDYRSKSGVEPVTNSGMSTMASNVSALKKGTQLFDVKARWSIFMLYLVEYASWDSQREIGMGCSDSMMSRVTGRTDELGYHTGTPIVNYGERGYTQYRNIEGLWDSVYDWMPGIAITTSGKFKIGNSLIGNVKFDVYPKTFALSQDKPGLEWFLHPTSYVYDPTYTADKCCLSNDSPAPPSDSVVYDVYAGGGNMESTEQGLFCVGVQTKGSTSPDIGCRLMFCP